MVSTVDPRGRAATCGPSRVCPAVSRGVYALELRLRRTVAIDVGTCGPISLPRGRYLYLGSAQRNLLARVGRHFTRAKRIKWHIDYLTTHPDVVVRRAHAWELAKEWECRLASALVDSGAAERCVPGFGASDCRCSGHLLRVLSPGWLATLDHLHIPEMIPCPAPSCAPSCP